MTRAAGIVCSLVLMALSLALLISGAYLWARSLHHVDVVARVDAAPNHQSLLRGIGSYKGAILFGSIEDPLPPAGPARYAHTVFPIVPPDGSSSSMLKVVPEAKRSALGFGASRGELRVKLPTLFSFLNPPPRKFEVVYVPYYAFMLLGLIYPARLLVRRKVS